jgi:hypothetical protein
VLCTESGGEGRNIQFCNTLINFDVPWNPMAIEQRIGRIDRIGQQREVFVFNLVTRGTLEEQILQLLDEKISMFELVVGEVGPILGASRRIAISRPSCSMPGFARPKRAATRRSMPSAIGCTRRGSTTRAPRPWTNRCSAKTSKRRETA